MSQIYKDILNGKWYTKTNGKVEIGTLSKKKLKSDSAPTVASQVEQKDAQIAKLQALNEFLEINLRTLSVKEHDEYNALKDS